MKKKLMIFVTVGLLTVAAFAFGSYKDRTPSCPWEGTPECPKLGCPLADTPQCPFEKDETAMALPACCKK